GLGFPSAQVFQIELNTTLGVLGAGTHGRGLWEIAVFGTPTVGGSNPALTGLVTSPASPLTGQQFTFTLTGAWIEPTAVEVLFNGPGCAPCIVPNNALTTKT